MEGPDPKAPGKRKSRRRRLLLLVLALVAILSLDRILAAAGSFLVFEEKPVRAQAVVVLNTGVEYFPRLEEAARLYRAGLAAKVVINGNRKTDALRRLEARGFVPCCAWQENRLRVLALCGVPRTDVIAINAEDAYDTVSEAEAVGMQLLQRDITSVILATSKSHTRRAHFIWQRRFGDRMAICPVAARTDPFDPGRWWRSGRQVRWVLAEYGAWIYYGWKSLAGGTGK